MAAGQSLRQAISERRALLVPGAANALTARVIEDRGFEAIYLTGAGLANTLLGVPDIGLVTLTELAQATAAISAATALPLIVDADTGFGNALNVQRTVRLLAGRGASAIQLEDQSFPKRCGHLAEKRLVPTAEMVGKLKAALDARPSAELLVIARTDAIAVEGFAPALDRAEAYLAAGADVIFVEAPRSADELAGIAERFHGRAPLLANMVEGGSTPLTDAAQLERLGFSLVIFPGGTVRALAGGLQGYFASLKTHGTTAPYRDRMLDFKGVTDLVGTPEMLALGKRYEGG
jgi:2-methylisocitrate lyase-like PEP mutase family enzyme